MEEDDVTKILGEFKFDFKKMTQDEVLEIAINKTRKDFDKALECFKKGDTFTFTRIVAHVFSMAAGSLVYAHEKTHPQYSSELLIESLLMAIRADLLQNLAIARKEKL